MKPINELATTETVKQFSQTQRTGDTEQDRVFVNELFKQLAGIFPGWRAAFPDEQIANQAKRQWLTGLVENGVTTPEQIEMGLKAARSADTPFIPSVGQFIEWTKDNRMTEYVSLPRPPANEQIAAEHISQLKDILGGI